MSDLFETELIKVLSEVRDVSVLLKKNSKLSNLYNEVCERDESERNNEVLKAIDIELDKVEVELRKSLEDNPRVLTIIKLLKEINQ